MSAIKQGAPIFIHSLWRSGSTYLFEVFRRSEAGYWCYQEPIHEIALGAREHPERLLDIGVEMGVTHRHPVLDKPYYYELHAIHGRWKDLIRKSVVYDEYFASEASDSLMAYVSVLIRFADGTPVIQECRTSNRIKALKNAAGGTHLYLWRNPWDQWWSFKISGYFDLAIQLILNAPKHPPSIEVLRQAIGFAEFHDDSIDSEFRYFDARRLSAEQSYLAFFTVWCLGWLEGQKHADLSICIDHATESVKYRAAILQKLEQLGMSGLDLDDCHIHRTTFGPQEAGFFKPIEEKVFEFLLSTGTSKTSIEAIAEASKRQALKRQPRRSVRRYSDVAEDASRARQIVIRNETNSYHRMNSLRAIAVQEQTDGATRDAALAATRAELERHQQESQRLEKAKRDAEHAAADASSQMEAARAQFGQLQVVAKQTKAECAALEATLAATRLELERRQQESQRLEKAKREAERATADASSQVEAARAQLSQLQAVVKLTKAEGAALEATLAAMRAELERRQQESKSQVEAAQLQLSRTEAAARELGQEVQEKADGLLREGRRNEELSREANALRADFARLEESRLLLERTLANALFEKQVAEVRLSSLQQTTLGRLAAHFSGTQSMALLGRLSAASDTGSNSEGHSFPSQALSAKESQMSLDDLLGTPGEPFVRAAYRAILGREADDGGLRHYLGRLSLGYSKSSILCALALSREGKCRAGHEDLLQYSEEEFVRAAYRRLLGREPDTEGMSFYLAELRRLGSPRRVLQNLLDSEEAVARAISTGERLFRLQLAELVRLERQSRGWRRWLDPYGATLRQVNQLRWFTEREFAALRDTHAALDQRLQGIERRLQGGSGVAQRESSGSSFVTNVRTRKALRPLNIPAIMQEVRAEAATPGSTRAGRLAMGSLIFDQVAARVHTALQSSIKSASGDRA